MVIRNWIKEEEIIASLNVVPPSPSSYIQFLENILGIDLEKSTELGAAAFLNWRDRTNRVVRTPHAGFVLNYLYLAPTLNPKERWRLPDTISQEEAVTFSEALTSAHLRRYVDSWIDTGQHPDGSESPEERDLYKAPAAFDALHGYLSVEPLTVLPFSNSNGSELTIAVSEPNWGRAKNFFEAPIIEAQRLFVGIFASDWKNGVRKCRYRTCGRYFLHPNSRQPYKHGTFCCSAHARRVVSNQLHQRSRRAATAELIELAAKKLLALRFDGPHWENNAELKRRLVAYLNFEIPRRRLHGYRDELTVKWLSRHREMIERKRSELSGSR
jgi:hypothetical protein